MTEVPGTDRDRVAPVDIGDYCRRVEDYLTRASGGYLVRIVGPGFELVRRWAQDGVPLSVVYRGIDLKAERHQAGQAKRPLRIEFCEADVRHVYDDWRRAVGLHPQIQPGESGDAAEESTRRKPSLSKHLQRAIERLGRVAGRLDLPDALRDAAGGWLQELVALQEEARHARGAARDEIAARVALLDARVATESRSAATPALLAELDREAAQELAPYRERLPSDSWRRALAVTADRLLRERFGLGELGGTGLFSTETGETGTGLGGVKS